MDFRECSKPRNHMKDISYLGGKESHLVLYIFFFFVKEYYTLLRYCSYEIRFIFSLAIIDVEPNLFIYHYIGTHSLRYPHIHQQSAN